MSKLLAASRLSVEQNTSWLHKSANSNGTGGGGGGGKKLTAASTSSSSSGCGDDENVEPNSLTCPNSNSNSSAENFLNSLAEPMAKYLTLAANVLAGDNLNGANDGPPRAQSEWPANNDVQQQQQQRAKPAQVTKQVTMMRRDESLQAAVLNGDVVRIPMANESADVATSSTAAAAPPLQSQATISVNPARPLTRAALSRAKFAIRSYTIAAGMPRRSRSLVEDARMDSQRNRQLLDELRGEQLERSDSLRNSNNNKRRGPQDIPEVVGEQDEEEAEAEADELPAHDAQEELQKTESQTEADGQEEEELVEVAAELERCLSDFPRHISDLDHCNHLLIKYEPELDPTHPGFHDLEYRARRKEVAEVAFNYKFGDRIPAIAYSAKELTTWKTIYLRLKEAYKRYACEQHNSAIRQLEEALIYSPNRIPQLHEVSEFLEKKTGWRLRPVAGLLSARDFLASLAFRVFQTTQYIRHWGNPEHSVEPDCIHELMGHIPMLCDPEFAQFSQELGLASLGASDEQIERFATLYWFTVEFGLCHEQGQLKCYGAGLLSSYGEMEHALESGKPALKEFVPEETAIETYDDSDYQVVYYVARSFEEAKAKIKTYAAGNLKRPYELAYDPYTCSVKELKSYEQLELYVNAIKSDLTRLSSAISKLKSSSV